MLNRALGMFRRDPQLSVVLFVGVVIAFLSLSPTLMLFYGSFRSKPLGVPSDFSLAHYINAYTDPLTYELLFNSFLFATGSALLATFLAATLAWISIRTNAPFRKFFELTAIVPNIFPPVMLAVSWTVLLSPRTGLINRALMELFGLGEAPFNIYSDPRNGLRRSVDHRAAGLPADIGGALFHGPRARGVRASGRIVEPADRLAHYVSDRAPGDAGGGDAQLRARHRKLRHAGDHRAAGAHRSVYDQNLPRSDRRVSAESEPGRRLRRVAARDHDDIRLFLSSFDGALGTLRHGHRARLPADDHRPGKLALRRFGAGGLDPAAHRRSAVSGGHLCFLCHLRPRAGREDLGASDPG